MQQAAEELSEDVRTRVRRHSNIAFVYLFTCDV